MKQRVVFPLFNAIIGAVFGALIGYFISRPVASILLGVLVGAVLGLAIELLLSRLGSGHWLYRRRVLLVVLLEIPIVTFLLGPYAYVIVAARPDHHVVCCETPLDYGAIEYEEVEIRTSDGIVLAGWFVSPKEPPGAVIVLLHGAHGDRSGTAWHAGQLIQAGYGVLLFDQRALGESTGEMVYFGWMEGYDLLAVVDYLESRSDVNAEKIGAVGLSGGGHIALNAAHIEPDRIAALWLDGVQAQSIEDFPEAENLGERFVTVINALIYKMAEIHFGRSAPPAFVDILTELDQTKISIVAGGLDDFENRVSQKYAGAIGANAKVWLIENAWHVGGPMVIPDEYSQRMLEFFDTSLER
jgi:pimeloyl-ACP methyl ester carboxylesterase